MSQTLRNLLFRLLLFLLLFCIHIYNFYFLYIYNVLCNIVKFEMQEITLPLFRLQEVDMNKFENLSQKEQSRGSEILILMLESSEVEFQAYTGAIPMTSNLCQRISTLLKKNHCCRLLKDFSKKYPDFLIP